VTKETKISLGILIIGAIALTIYWFMPQASSEPIIPKHTQQIEEQVILPQYEKSIYQDIPEVQSYLSDLRKLVKEGKSILPLRSSEIDNNAQKAQTLLLEDTRFLSDTKDGNISLHNDMMRILPALVSSLDDKTAKLCTSTTCYQAEKYNFVTNTTTRAIIDVDNLKVLDIQRYANMQADISLRLTHMAQAIALHAPDVAKELGFTPRKRDITMANVRGTMKGSPCENTDHLCVAPTFTDHANAKALWAVVDLTELKLAAAKWAGLGKTTTPACISERSLQNRYIMKNFCQKDSYLEKNGWSSSIIT
jgi:hypothetical protein